MSEPFPIRRRQPSHRRRRQRLGLAFDRPGPVVAAAAIDAPTLGFGEPDRDRGVWVSGFLSGGAHAALVLALFWISWNAPRILKETVIPVRLLRELPGSNQVPEPKTLTARRPISAVALSPAQAAAIAQAHAPRISPEALRMVPIQSAPPQRIERRQLEAERLETQQATQILDFAALNPALLRPVEIDPGNLKAPTVRFDGPRQLDSLAPSAIMAPQSFADMAQVSRGDYSERAVSRIAETDLPAGGSAVGVVQVESAVGAAYLGAGAAGGTGEGAAPSAVPCLQSAYVDRYLTGVRLRTRARWELPEQASADAFVKLRFRLDASGSATSIEFIEGAQSLAPSVIQALRAAAPFPPMDDNVRCLSEIPLLATFTANPSR
ncbi:MAG: TonB C-terminal domain-containing protein [Myxococcota bacterium]